MDSQQIAIIGKHILIADLIAGDMEVAEPPRDRGIDLIAFRDRTVGGSFWACPIQLKTATDAVFGLDNKYAHFPGLRIVFVWHTKEPSKAQIFALTYDEALSILAKMKYDLTDSWKDGKYTTTRPSEKLKKILVEEFLVSAPSQWAYRLGMSNPGPIS
jgi:hypothetical protein